MKIALNVLGVILAIVGAIWILQGVNILPGSFMTGDLKWAVIGLILIAISGGLLVFNNTRRPPTQP